MPLPRRIFISAPLTRNLTPARQTIKKGLLKKVVSAGYEPQLFAEAGMAASMPWNFPNLERVISRCHGAIILGVARYELHSRNATIGFSTEYSHCEGTMAIAKSLPILVIAEESVGQRGVLDAATGEFVVHLPAEASAKWIRGATFQQRFEAWQQKVEKRRDVFFGYSSEAASTAAAIVAHLRENEVAVHDWQDFETGDTILARIDQAERTCNSGMFLFTKDDAESPRDNVLFEAGFFVQAKGTEGTLIIVERGAKIPADLGGKIVLMLDDRNNIEPIRAKIKAFFANR
jgi:predicted nucleotide-binding protein